MKKKFLILCMALIWTSCFVFADEAPTDNTNWGVRPLKQFNQPPPKKTPQAEKEWQEEKDTTIYDNYGSESSPAFLNRENINPNESDYDYGSPESEN